MARALPRSVRAYLRTPAPTWHKIRSWLIARWQLRACTRVGSWPRVSGRVYIRNGGEIILGERILIRAEYVSSVLTSLPGGRLEVGNQTFINYGADITATKLIKIGSNCLIGTGVNILDNDFHDVADHHRFPEARPVIIGDGVWIGNHAIILPGVTLGDEAVVGAGSVVTSSVPSRAVVAGNPARLIKNL